jgi:ElaB/YqjD/DUF883 family membrane-anchored ribosome-binding protein
LAALTILCVLATAERRLMPKYEIYNPMKNHTQAIYNDMEQLANDARALLAATADVAGEKVDAVRKRLNSALGSSRAMLNRAEDDGREEARAAARCILDNPRQSIAIALAAGVLIGCFIAFGCSRNDD